MRREMLEILVCPACRGELECSFDGDHLESGQLDCSRCGRSYPVVEGVPQMLTEVGSASQSVSDSFGEQWQHYNEQRDLYRQQLLDWLRPVEADFFRDKLVLDAGCGKGRHLLASASFGARLVVGVDLGPASQVARQATSRQPGIEVVRADLMRLPFRPGTFDYAFSVGVLHHLPDPEGGFRSVLDTVKPGGHLSAWVYGRENNGWIIYLVNPFRQHVASRLPRHVLKTVAWALAWVIVALARGIYRPLNRFFPQRRLFYQDYILYLADFPQREVETIVYDHLHPEIAFYLTQDDFTRWFSRLEEVVIGWHNRNSWRGFARRPETRRS
ncbi:MAG: methyltransferase domain-containing protein [Vulcanimicrobiota bacterium]